MSEVPNAPISLKQKFHRGRGKIYLRLRSQVGSGISRAHAEWPSISGEVAVWSEKEPAFQMGQKN
jgi:hypothetical protein